MSYIKPLTGTTRLRRRYELECAHHLTRGLATDHKCRRHHGHRYILTLEVSGPICETDDMLIEYSDLDSIVSPVLSIIDHYDLNTLNERCSTDLAKRVSENPTVELLALWISHRLYSIIGSDNREMELTKILLEEDSRASVVWEP